MAFFADGTNMGLQPILQSRRGSVVASVLACKEGDGFVGIKSPSYL